LTNPTDPSGCRRSDGRRLVAVIIGILGGAPDDETFLRE